MGLQEKELQKQIKHQIETFKSGQTANSIGSAPIMIEQPDKPKSQSPQDFGSSNCISNSPIDVDRKVEKPHTIQSSAQLHSLNTIQNNYIDEEEYSKKRKRPKSGD